MTWNIYRENKYGDLYLVKTGLSRSEAKDFKLQDVLTSFLIDRIQYDALKPFPYSSHFRDLFENSEFLLVDNDRAALKMYSAKSDAMEIEYIKRNQPPIF